jgi:hypothetical protein
MVKAFTSISLTEKKLLPIIRCSLSRAHGYQQEKNTITKNRFAVKVAFFSSKQAQKKRRNSALDAEQHTLFFDAAICLYADNLR